MRRSLVLGVLALLAGLSLALVWWSIPGVAAGDRVTAAASGFSPPESEPRAAPDLVDAGSIELEPPPEASVEIAASTRAAVAPRIVDASESATGVDLHGSILVAGGDRRGLPPTTLVFRRGGFAEETLAIEAEYLLPRIAPGLWKVTAEAIGYERLEAEVLVLAEPRSQQIDFTMNRLPHVFVDMVTPSGEPFLKALRTRGGPVSRMSVVVVATSEPPRDRLGATLEDGYESYGVGSWRPANGWKSEAEVDEPRAGILELPRPMPAFVSACVENVVLRTRFAAAGTERIEFVLTPEDVRATRGSLRFRIVDAETGWPITEGRVGLHANGQFATGKEIIQLDGSVEFSDEPPGPRHLSIVCRGYEWVVEQVRLEAGRETDLGVVRLNRPISIEGLAVDEEGLPVRAWVSVWPLDRYEEAQRIAEHFCWRADDEGRFRIQPAGPKRYLLRANDEMWASETALVDASDGPVENVRLRVARGVPLTVTFGSGVERGSRLLLHDVQGQPVGERAVQPGCSTRIGLRPGRYRVRMEFDGAVREERSVDVRSEPVAIALGL